LSGDGRRGIIAMSDLFLGQIVMVPFNFAPIDTAFCDGQLLPISQYVALFSLLGTFYGGDGISTFALPNLQGSVPVNQGQGNGLSFYDIGQSGGASTITLNTTELPNHSHLFSVNTSAATAASPSEAMMPARPTAANASAYAVSQSGYPALAAQTMNSLATSGGGAAHNNMMPTLFINFVITLQGIFPPRN
jgi:microcystin-dependent protein